MRCFIGVVLSLILLVAFAPTILSTSLGKRFIAPIEVDTLSLNWLSPQTADGVGYKEDGMDVSIRKVTLEKSLLGILFSPTDWGTLLFEAPHIKATLQVAEEIPSKEKRELSFIPPISQVVVEKGKIEVDGVALHDLHLDVHREEGFLTLPFHLTALSSTERGEGKIEASGVLNGPEGHFLPLSFDLNIDRFPLATLDALLPDPLLVQAFGPVLTLKGQLEKGVYSLQVDGEKIQGGGTGTIHIDWSPDPSLLFGAGPIHLTFDQQTLAWDIVASLHGDLGFLGPQLSFKGTPTAFTLSADNLKISPIKLNVDKTVALTEPVKGELTRLPYPYQITTPLLFQLDRASIRGGPSSLVFEGKIQGGMEGPNEKVPHFSLHFLKERGGPVLIDGEGTVVANNPSIDALLGGEGHLLFSAQGFPKNGDMWEFDPVSFQFKSPLLDTEGYLVVDSEGKIEGGQPVTLHYTLTPSALTKLKPHLPHLIEPAQLTLEMALTSSFIYDQPKTWNLQTSVTSPTLKFDDFSFDNLIGSIDLSGETSELLATLEAKTKGKTLLGGGISVDLHLKDILSDNQIAFENSHYTLSANLRQFPTAFLKEAQELFGDTVTLQIDSKGTLDEAFGTAKVDSDGMQGRLAWQWDDKAIVVSSPHFKALLPASFFDPLLEPVPITFEIDNLTIPKDSYFEGSGQGNVQTAATTVYVKENGKKVGIPAFEGRWNLDRNGLHYSIKTSNDGLSLSGSVRSRIPLPTEWTMKDLNFSVLLRGIDLPSALLGLAPSLYRLEPVLEPTFSIDLDLKLDQGDGTIVSSLISPNGTLLVDGYLQDGWFFLNRQLELSLQMTPKVAKGLLGELVPLISSGVRGRSPIRVAIDPRGFYVPLLPFDVAGLEIGQAIVDLDQLDVNPTEDLGDLLSLLGVQTTPGKPESLWFTPLYLSYHQGIATLRRVDILIAEKYPIALWGKVDLENDRVYLELGLGAKTLSQAFGMKKLPKDYILPISLRGSLNSPKIDKPKATAKIGALLAQIEGSPQGLLLSGVLDLVSGGLMSEGVPPPTTTPLPWATDEELEQPPHPNTPMKKIIKGVEQGAKSLLKKLF